MLPVGQKDSSLGKKASDSLGEEEKVSLREGRNHREKKSSHNPHSGRDLRKSEGSMDSVTNRGCRDPEGELESKKKTTKNSAGKETQMENRKWGERGTDEEKAKDTADNHGWKKSPEILNQKSESNLSL